MPSLRKLVFAFSIVVSTLTLAQTVKVDMYAVFRNLDQNNGLTNNEINDINQDYKGYIWIATEHGLNRFDGQRFIHFLHNKSDSSSISGNIITSLATDSKGNLWVGTTDGLNFYNRETGKFTRHTSKLFNYNTLRSKHIRKLLLQNDSLLWLETLDGTLTKWRITTGKMQHYGHAQIRQAFYRYHALRTDNNGNIWFGGRTIPIHVLDTKTDSIRRIWAGNTKLNRKRDNDLADILFAGNGQIYLAGTDGFYAFNKQTETVEKLYASSSFSLCELQNGKILVGSASGLLIYDSEKNEFTKYKSSIDNPNSLANNRINKVLQDKDGNIWVGGSQGLSVLKATNTSTQHFFHITGNEQSLAANRLSDALQAQNGDIWIATKTKGLELWDTTNNTFTHFRHNPNSSKSITSDRISRIYEDKQGVLWLGLWAGLGFNKFDPKTETFSRYAISQNSRKHDWYSDLLEDSKHNFWLGLWGSYGLQRFNKTTGKILRYNYSTGLIPVNKKIRKLVTDGQGNIFPLINSPIIYKFSSKTNRFSAFAGKNEAADFKRFNSQYNYKLPTSVKTLYDIATNKQGTTFFASDAGLIAYFASTDSFALAPKLQGKKLCYQPLNQVFWLFTETQAIKLTEDMDIIGNYTLPDGLSQTDLDQMRFSNKDYAWLITENGLFRFFPEKSALLAFKLANYELNCAKNKFVFTEKTIWAANKTGLWKFDISDPKKAERLAFPVAEHLLQNISHMFKTPEHGIIMVSKYGIAKLNPKTEEIKVLHLKKTAETFNFKALSGTATGENLYFSDEYFIHSLQLSTNELRLINKPDKHMLSSRLTSCLLNDSAGNLWIGTTDKGLNKYHIESKTFTHFNTEKQLNRMGKEVSCLYLAHNSKVWIGTEKGLFSYNEKLDTIESHSQNKSIHVQSIIASSDSVFWLGTNTGLYQYHIESGNYTLFSEHEGIPITEFTKGAVKLQNGKILMTGNKGFIVFNPIELQSETVIANTEITGFSLFGNAVDVNINSGDTIWLNYTSNHFSIEFASIDFIKPKTNLFAYKLSGTGEKWIFTNHNAVDFTKLAAGSYLLTLSSQEAINIPEKHAKLHIIISPPYWKTLWFWGIIISLLAGIVTAYLSAYIKQIKLSHQNTTLKQKLLSSQMNPHFIFNSLAAIQSHIYKCEPEAAGNYLANFSRLIRLILENSRSETISVDNEILTLKLYLNLQQLRFADKFSYNIHIDPNIHTRTTQLPPMLAQPFVENSIEHGIMHLSEKGEINIRFGLTDNYLSIEITDNGVGLQKSEELNRNKPQHSSLATGITRERLAVLSKKQKQKFTISVLNRNKTEGTMGTKVVLQVPYK